MQFLLAHALQHFVILHCYTAEERVTANIKEGMESVKGHFETLKGSLHELDQNIKSKALGVKEAATAGAQNAAGAIEQQGESSATCLFW